MRISLDYLISFLMLIASGLYLSGITPLSPIYFVFGIAIIFYFFKLILHFEIHLNSLAFFNLFICFFSVFVQLVLIPNTKIPTTIGLALPYLFYFICFQSLKSLTKTEIMNLCAYMLTAHVILISIDAIIRLANPNIYATNIYSGHTRESGLAYMFKHNSIMYPDSNFVGVQVCLTYFFTVYLNKENLLVSWAKNLRYILLVLVVLTTSRSANITMIFYTLIFNKVSFPFQITKKQVFWLSGIIVFLIIASVFILSFVKNDESFNSKFMILYLAIDLLKSIPLSSIFLGIGIGNTFSFIGIGAHNLIVTLALETGLIGLTLFMLSMYFSIKKTNGKALYLLFPLFTMGFSFVSLALPFLFTFLAIIYVIENNTIDSKSVIKES
ncbi:MAG: hypothetical protein ACOYMA_17615 [Bacteroidia bacterium]